MKAEFFAIPIEDKFILYRPLRRLAFLGNAAMAQWVAGVTSGRVDAADLPPDVLDYLERIDFLTPDPPPPEPRDPEYCPTSAVLLMTSRCNLRCIYCYADAGEQVHHDLPLELAIDAIDRVYENARQRERPYFELNFHGGGEPTLLWDTLRHAVAHARAKDLPCRVSVVSNGVWARHQREWIRDHVDHLTLSVDGAPETQDRQRPFATGHGSSGAVMETMRFFDRCGYNYSIRMTALAPWAGLARDVAFLCEETGCRRIQVEPAFGDERGAYQAPSRGEAQAFVEGFMEAFEVAWRVGRRVVFSGARPWLLTSSFCSAPYGGLVVTPTGRLVGCYEVTDAHHPLAALCTVGSMVDGRVHVNADRRHALLTRLEERRAGCCDCFCYWHCAGDCHAKTLYPGVDAAPVTSARCWMNRTIMAQTLLWHISTADDGVWRGEKERPPVKRRSRTERV